MIKTKFEELLSRREAAHISEAVEASDDKLHFRVIEAPQVQAQPTFPNRPLFLSIVLVVALAAGAGAAVLLQMMDNTIGSALTLSEEFEVPVLAMIPLVEHAAGAAMRRHAARRFTLAVVALLGVYGAFLALNQLVDVAGFVRGYSLSELLERILSHVR